jgi:aspartate aminotransferase-like enzyme
MIIADKGMSNLVVDVVVVVVAAVVEFGYRWGQIVNRHDVHFVVPDSYEICTLVKV